MRVFFYLAFLFLVSINVYANEPHVSDFKETMVVVELPEPFGETKVTIKLDKPQGTFVFASVESKLGHREVYGKDVKNYDTSKTEVEKIDRVFLNGLSVRSFNFEPNEPISSFSVCMIHGFGKKIKRRNHESTYMPVLVLFVTMNDVSIYSLPVPTENMSYDEINGCEWLSEQSY